MISFITILLIFLCYYTFSVVLHVIFRWSELQRVDVVIIVYEFV